MTDIAVKQTLEEVEMRAKQLPDPIGFKILCAVPNVEASWGGRLKKSDETIRVEEQTTVVLYVIKLGPDCYQDPKRFPSGPWCKEGDFVVTRAYSGTRLKIHGKEFRIINDDSVDATVQDPRGIGLP